MDVSSYFRDRRNQFHKNSYQRIWRSNPFRQIVGMDQFPMEEGKTPTVITYTHELPTAYPTSLTEVAVSTGTGNAACNPTPTVIKRGQTERTFQLYGASFETDVFCLSDIKRAHQAAEAVGAMERSLREYISVWWSDYYRVQNISMVDNKVGIDGAASIDQVVNTDGDHTGLNGLPTHEVAWAHLNTLWHDLVQSGVSDEYAIGMDAGGRPVFPLVVSQYYYNKLFNDTETREQVKYFAPQKNLQALGPQFAVNGFAPFLDLFPIRYGNATPIASEAGLTASNMIYPHVNANATVGRKYTKNPDYKTAALGGDAQFEVITILPANVYQTLYEPANPAAFGDMMDFKPTEYVGEFDFINNATFRGDNDRRNMGYYLADIRVAAKPIWTDLGYSILTLAKDI
jgi:hypothetical protein